MKTLFNYFAIGILSSIAILCQAQQATTAPSPTPYSVVRREANANVLQRTTYSLSPSGQVIPHIHHYTEVATGLNFKDPATGEWVPSKEEIDILPDGTACATNGPCQVFFPADIYDGTITLVTPDGLELQERPVGLSYDDDSNTVLFAELTNSVGEIISSNEVVYPNAFVGISADLLYIYRKGGFEQDVVFREQPPTPEQFGMNSDDSRLQLLTEFFNSPTPVQTVGPVNSQDGLQDTTLAFGQMKMIQGKAFLMGTASPPNHARQIPVYKSWIVVDGRTLLIEEVPYQRMSAELETLPVPSVSTASSANSMLDEVSAKRMLPPIRPAEETTNSMQLAKANFKQNPGVVFDYVTIDSDETNFTFQGDTTYFVSDEYNLSGKTIFEGGAVIKMNGNGQLDIDGDGVVDCATAPYRPAIFSSLNDNSVGESISGSTGSPALGDVNTFLYFNPTNGCLHDLRFSYSDYAIAQWSSPALIDVWDCQFFSVDEVVSGWNVGLYNVLIGGRFTNCDDDIIISGTSLIAENVTADQGSSFIMSSESSTSLALTNCLITGQALLDDAGSGTLFTNHVICLPSPSSLVYQVVGAGSYYLAINTYQGQGTVNIDPALLADITNKTTHPPMVFSNETFSVATNFGPQALRDNSGINVDIGYHYPVLDYVFGGCDLHTNLTFTAGTAVGWFQGDGSYPGEPYAISLENGANLIFNGNATQPCFYANYLMVQEGGNGNWTGSGYIGSIMFNGSNTNLEPQISADFTKWTEESAKDNFFRDNIAYGAGSFTNCEFYDGNISTYDMQYLNFNNCLFFRDCSIFWDQDYALNFDYENCTFYNGCLTMARLAAC